MIDGKYTNAAQQRVLRTLRLLTELRESGATAGEIARRLETAPSNTTRDLGNLRMARLVISTGRRWYALLDGTARYLSLRD